MVIPLLLRYVLLLATRQSTVKVSLSALATVFLLSAGFLLIKTGDSVPPAAILCAESYDCNSGQYEEQQAEKEQQESRSRVQSQGDIAAINGDEMLSALSKQFQLHPNQFADLTQQLLARVADVFGGVTP